MVDLYGSITEACFIDNVPTRYGLHGIVCHTLLAYSTITVS